MICLSAHIFGVAVIISTLYISFFLLAIHIFDAFDQFSFYLLPPKEQKMLALALGYVQNGPKCRMGPFVELNYETATKVNFCFSFL